MQKYLDLKLLHHTFYITCQNARIILGHMVRVFLFFDNLVPATHLRSVQQGLEPIHIVTNYEKKFSLNVFLQKKSSVEKRLVLYCMSKKS